LKRRGDPRTPEEMFGQTIHRVRTANGQTQESIAQAMRAHGFEFSQLTVSRIERGSRPVRLNEAIALARVLDVDLLTTFVTAVAGEAGESAAITERVAFVKVLQLTQELAAAEAQQADLAQTVADLRADLAAAEAEWQTAVQALNRVTNGD
jgi:transcriptional regulator with XRE-family HTH domain